MASPEKRHPDNAEGPVFVDSTCIDCDTCRWMAPDVFDRRGSQSRVHTQAGGLAAELATARALVSCPTGSIGGAQALPLADALKTLPLPIEPGSRVSHCGFHADASFGAASYLLQRPEGNVLVDSPRFAAPLVERLESLGGVAMLFLSHRDDVADHARFAAHFGCERVMHERDLASETRDVERVLTGTEPVRLAPDLLALPVPGHTEGSTCLLHERRHLFTGDHLAWSPALQSLHAFRDFCWFDWDEQQRSVRTLTEHRFNWVLPAHGRRVKLSAPEMASALEACLGRMATT